MFSIRIRRRAKRVRSHFRIRTTGRGLALLLFAALISAGDAGSAIAEDRVVIGQLIRDGSLDSAQTMIDDALDDDSTNVWLWLQTDNIQRRTGDTERRLDALHRLLRYAPKSREAHLRLAEIYLDAGLTAEVAPHMDLIGDTIPRNDFRAFYLSGRFAEAKSEYDAAIQFYRRAWQLIERRPIWLIE